MPISCLQNKAIRTFCINRSLPIGYFFHAFLSPADVLTESTFSKKTLSGNSSRVLNSLELDQAWPFVGPDLGPNYLQRLSADDTCMKRVTELSPPLENC